MLLGSFEDTLTSDMRLCLPEIFLDTLENKQLFLVLMEDCLEIHITSEFAQSEGKEFIECRIDKERRVAIPEWMAEKTGISKDVAILGGYDCIAIYDSEAYRKIDTTSENSIADLYSDICF